MVISLHITQICKTHKIWYCTFTYLVYINVSHLCLIHLIWAICLRSIYYQWPLDKLYLYIFIQFNTQHCLCEAYGAFCWHCWHLRSAYQGQNMTIDLNQHLSHTVTTNLNIVSLTKIWFTAGLLYCIALDWQGVPDKLESVCAPLYLISVWNTLRKEASTLTQMTLCLKSSAWTRALCSLPILLWWRLSLRDPSKNWETSWRDQESGRSWMTFSVGKTCGCFLSRSTAALVRSLEFR